MEWNAARLKFPILSGEAPPPAAAAAPVSGGLQDLLGQRSYADFCKLGLALTWPLALAALAIMLVLLLKP